MKKSYTKLDIVKDVIFFFVTTAAAYGYLLLMLLIASFIANSILHLKLDDMFVYAAVGTAVIDIWYIVKKVRKYSKS